MLDAVLVGKFVKSTYANVFLRYSSTVVDKFGSRLTRHDFLPPTWTGIRPPMLLGTGIFATVAVSSLVFPYLCPFFVPVRVETSCS